MTKEGGQIYPVRNPAAHSGDEGCSFFGERGVQCPSKLLVKN